MPDKPKTATVQPLGRVGFSGARVFMFFPGSEPSRPYVGKIHTAKGILREIHGLKNAFRQFHEAAQEKFTRRGPSKWIIALPLVDASPDGKQASVRELADMLFSWEREPKESSIFAYPEEMVLGILDRVYTDNCRLAMQKVSSTTVPLGEEYAWYLRDCATDERLRTWLASSANDEEFETGGGTYPNPLRYVRRLREAKRTLPTCTVHGDLHSSNIVMDSNDIPRLLDFTWCQKGKHVLKDFLVMECSVRFLMMPNHLGQSQQTMLDELLLQPDEERAAALLEEFRRFGVDARTCASVQRCIKIVSCLRGHARRVCGDAFQIEDYWACQALVLYGLMRIDRYPFGRCARALSQLCGRLRERAYLG